MSADEQEDLRELLYEKAELRRRRERRELFDEFDRHQRRRYGRTRSDDEDHDDYRSEHDYETEGTPRGAGHSKQKRRKDTKLRKLHDSLLSAMLKALVSRRVKITPEELQVTDA